MVASTTSHITISAKGLGELAQEGFCPRCFWLGRQSPLLDSVHLKPIRVCISRTTCSMSGSRFTVSAWL